MKRTSKEVVEETFEHIKDVFEMSENAWNPELFIGTKEGEPEWYCIEIKLKGVVVHTAKVWIDDSHTIAEIEEHLCEMAIKEIFFQGLSDSYERRK